MSAALNANLIWLAEIGLLNSAVADYYCLRILVGTYSAPSESMTSQAAAGVGIKSVLWAFVLWTSFLGMFPSVVLNQARDASALTK